MAPSRTPLFNPQLFLTQVGKGKSSLQLLKRQTLFSQGEVAEAVFYIHLGKVKLTVVSQQGKEAVIAILEQGAFFGESCLAGQGPARRRRRSSRIAALYASTKPP